MPRRPAAQPQSVLDNSSEDDAPADNEVQIPLRSDLPRELDLSPLRNYGLPALRKHWMNVSVAFMEPKKMCAVNQFVHIMSEIGDPYVSTSCELVLFGSGTSIPEHFREMVYAMEMVNQISVISGSFVPWKGLTRAISVPVGKQTAKSKKFDVIGVERLVAVAQTPNQTKRKNYIKTVHQVDTFLAQCSRLAQNTEDPTYARTPLVHMHWGIIPVEYEENGVKKRKIFHVLRVVPQPGLHLMDLIRRRFFARRYDAPPKEAAMVKDVCHYLEHVISYEADINYGMLGVFNSDLPHPWTVTDPRNPTSVQRLLSPFTVLDRLLHHIPGNFCGQEPTHLVVFKQSELIVDGFPDLRDPEAAQAAIDQYAHRQELYLKALHKFEFEFDMALAEFRKSPEFTYKFTSILRDGPNNYNLLRPKLNMVFMLHNYMKFSERKVYSDADRLTIPKLGIAVIDYFIFFETNALFRMMDEIRFIEAHVGEQLAREVVTETKIAMKYRVTDVQSLEDFPKAGQLKSARDGFKRNLTVMVASEQELTAEAASFYESYLRLQFTATMNGLLMDSWMSDRVYRCASIMEQMVGDLCPLRMMKEALDWTETNLPRENQQLLMGHIHDEVAFVWGMMVSGMCKLNETVRANPLNLSIIWGMLKSDVLTFLGLHNQSWRWMMYCMQIAPMFGHLRVLTEDGHAARSECILTAKPNSVGLNDVIIKTVNFCFEGLLSSVVSMTDEERRVLRLDKVDRKTRAGMEASQAVELANDRVISKPTSSKLMQAVAVDEALRSFDESGLAGLINTGLPRDSNAGEGTTTKVLKPDKGYNEKGETRQLPGMGWYVLIFATNSNARNSTFAEMLRTLACGAMVTYAPGAPHTMGLASALTVRDKRKRGQSNRTSNATGESMMPSDPHECKLLAYLFSVTGMLSRHIGLVNKTGQSNWEISNPVHQYLDLVRQYFLEHFTCFVSTTYAQSCDRQFKGFIARSVSACLMCTVVNSLRCHESDLSAANFDSLLAMESSALTLYWANVALLNSFAHLADSSLAIVNQLIRWRLQVPVLSLDFLVKILDADQPVDETCQDFQDLRRFLERLRNAKTREDEASSDPIKHFTGSYVQVPGIGSIVDYGLIENYLFRFCGINQASVYAYLKMFKESAHRSLDLTAVLDLPQTMLDVRILFERCKVRYDQGWYSPPGSYHDKGTNYLILVADQQDPKGTTGVGNVWAHVVQVLLVSSLIGPVELHADNSVALGKGLFQLIVGRVAAKSAVPYSSLTLETFTQKHGEVTGDGLRPLVERDYFWRPRVCYKAWRSGEIKDLNCVVGDHPLEDVIHIHSWVQLHYMHMGKLPGHFYHMPKLHGRGAELVPSRIYPVLGEDDATGTICVCPEGKCYALLCVLGQLPQALHLTEWQKVLREKGLQVAPLVHRKHAVLRMEDASLAMLALQTPKLPQDIDGWNDAYLCVLHSNISGANYLSFEGNYETSHGDGTMFWRDVHNCLVKLGKHIVAPRAVVAAALDGSARLPSGDSYTHVLGWLRYPDDFDKAGRDLMYVAFRVAAQPSDCDDVCVLGLPFNQCSLREDLSDVECADRLLP